MRANNERSFCFPLLSSVRELKDDYRVAFRKLLELDLDPAAVMRAIGRPLVIPPNEKTGYKQVVLWIK